MLTGKLTTVGFTFVPIRWLVTASNSDGVKVGPGVASPIVSLKL